MGELIYRASEPHVCKPIMDERWIKSPMGNKMKEPYDSVPPVGTIWRCECGQLWEVWPENRRGYVVNRRWREASIGTTLKVWWRLR